MNEDRELLEWAAFAAGMRVRHYIGNLVHLDNDGLDAGAWNPLDDDGDALRLAVKLGIDIAPFIASKVSRSRVLSKMDADICEAHESDPYAATRRAIVRAASSIGGEMT